MPTQKAGDSWRRNTSKTAPWKLESRSSSRAKTWITSTCAAPPQVATHFASNARISHRRDWELPQPTSNSQHATPQERIKSGTTRARRVSGRRSIAYDGGMSRLIRVALCLAATIFTSQTSTLAQTYGPVVKLGMPVDESTMAARRTQYVAPVYSDFARAGHIQGSVVMNANVDSHGKVIGLQTISGNPVLVRAALEAAMQWQYDPMVIDGQAVSVDTTITIVFALTDAQLATGPARLITAAPA